MNRYSFVVKIFERPQAINRFLDTVISNGYSHVPIIIVDDSLNKTILKKTHLEQLDIQHIHTEYDIGLSAGRNVGVRACKTPWFALFDDDMMLTDASRIDQMVSYAEENKLDIFSGMCPGHEQHYLGTFTRGTSASGHRTLVLRLNSPIGIANKHMVTHYALNFFVGSVQSVLSFGGWPDEIKIGREHVVFFCMAMEAKLRVGADRNYKVGHLVIRDVPEYTAMRKRTCTFDSQSLDRMETDGIRAVWPTGKAKFGWQRNNEGFRW